MISITDLNNALQQVYRLNEQHFQHETDTLDEAQQPSDDSMNNNGVEPISITNPVFDGKNNKSQAGFSRLFF